MGDLCCYRIILFGQVMSGDIESFSPPGFKIDLEENSNSLLTVDTDQAGMIGLIRHLHGIGLVLVSIERIPYQ